MVEPRQYPIYADEPAEPLAPGTAAPEQLPPRDEPVAEQGTGPAPSTHPVPRTRLGGAWIGVTISAVILLLLLVFILENNDTVDVGFFGQHGHLPLGVALLLAAVFGVLLVAIPGYGRIIQLRRAARNPERVPRHRRRQR
jgi:uncharacterized integral membrane protein